jgi:hypothetical protein
LVEKKIMCPMKFSNDASNRGDKIEYRIKTSDNATGELYGIIGDIVQSHAVPHITIHNITQ